VCQYTVFCYYETIKVWDFQTLKFVCTVQGHSNALDSIQLHVNDKTIKIWNTVSYECVFTLLAHTDAVRSNWLSEDETRLYSGSSDKTLKIWNTATNTCIATYGAILTVYISALYLSSTADRLVSGSLDTILSEYGT
jgi:WD40 repeat protein